MDGKQLDRFIELHATTLAQNSPEWREYCKLVNDVSYDEIVTDLISELLRLREENARLGSLLYTEATYRNGCYTSLSFDDIEYIVAKYKPQPPEGGER